jgi:hypothetical protein
MSFALLTGLLLVPTKAVAVVGDVTLTNVPPNSIVSFTNETTQEKVEIKTAERDDKGMLVVPLGEKKWQPGSYTVTIKESGGRTVSQPILLRDGSNQIDIGVIVGTTARTATDESKKAEEKKMEDKKSEEKSVIERVIPGFSFGFGGIGVGKESERREREPWPGKR